LARIGSVASVARLFPLLQDPNTRVVQAAGAAIAALGSPQTEQLTLQAARSTDPRVQREALRIVRAFGYKSALEVALSLIDTEDERLREAAIMALSLIEAPLAEQAMIQQARANDDKTRAMAVRALGLATKSDVSVRALAEACTDRDAWVRYYAVQALGRLRATEALPQLRSLLDDPAPQVRVSAVEALSHLPSNEAFSVLEAAARSKDPDLQRAAVLGFGELGHLNAIPILLDAIQSHDAATRLVAVSALGHFDTTSAVAGLGQAANDDDESVRLTAIGLLSELRSREATDALIGLLPAYRSQDRVQLALSAASPGRIDGIRAALVTADDEQAPVLASALVRMRTPQASSALISGLELPNAAARKAIVTALGALSTAESLDALRRAARDDTDPEVRRISALAATQI
jgi:HEAT repeat protein